jgi:ribosome recycling factor
MIKDIQQDAENKMKRRTEGFVQELAKLRTGRAHPSILDGIMVLYYGNPTPLNQVATVNVEDARTLSISAWDKSAIQAIDKAIRVADLGLNPVNSGTVIHVPLPPLTEERRKDLVKLLRGSAEEAKVLIRNIRRDANNSVKDLLKAKQITEDDERRGEEHIQKLTDRFITEIDKLSHAKEAELMQV